MRSKGLEILRAQEMGFCFGVKRALELAAKAAREQGSVESLGELVHNPTVVQRLSAMGLKVVSGIDEVRGRVVLVPSHGVGEREMAQLKARGLKIIDATCPYVRAAQRAAKRLAQAGFTVFIFGDPEHAEVKGILGWAGEGARVVRAPGEVDELPRRWGLLSQTTQSLAALTAFIKALLDNRLENVLEWRVFNTICAATVERQEAALELAGRVDLMLVIGGRNSANTRRLAELSSQAGVETHHIEGARELEPAWLIGKERIGLTAGASTPEEVVAEVEDLLRELARSAQA